MGFLDSVQNMANRGVASANRTANSTKLKMEQNDLLKQRKEFAAQLGASLYEATKDDPQWRAGRETVYDNISKIDERRAQIEQELAQLEQDAAAQAQAAMKYVCPTCGAPVHQGDAFCSGCGIAVVIAPVQAAEPVAPAGPTCNHCGEPINEGDLFCMACGARQEEEAVSEPAPVEPAALEVPATPVCVQCGAAINEGDLFCMTCGARQDQAAAPEADSQDSASEEPTEGE